MFHIKQNKYGCNNKDPVTSLMLAVVTMECGLCNMCNQNKKQILWSLGSWCRIFAENRIMLLHGYVTICHMKYVVRLFWTYSKLRYCSVEAEYEGMYAYLHWTDIVHCSSKLLQMNLTNLVWAHVFNFLSQLNNICLVNFLTNKFITRKMVYLIAWYITVGKPFFEQMMTQITDAYIWHHGWTCLMSWQNTVLPQLVYTQSEIS